MYPFLRFPFSNFLLSLSILFLFFLNKSLRCYEYLLRDILPAIYLAPFYFVLCQGNLHVWSLDSCSHATSPSLVLVDPDTDSHGPPHLFFPNYCVKIPCYTDTANGKEFFQGTLHSRHVSLDEAVPFYDWRHADLYWWPAEEEYCVPQQTIICSAYKQSILCKPAKFTCSTRLPSSKIGPYKRIAGKIPISENSNQTHSNYQIRLIRIIAYGRIDLK